MGFLENTAGTKENMHYSIIEPLPVILGNSRVLGGVELFVCFYLSEPFVNTTVNINDLILK